MECFECKVSYDKENDEGRVKKINEVYLVDAVSFTEAESIITEKVSEVISEQFEVKAVKKDRISEIFRHENNEGIWVKVKIALVVLDEVSGREKRTNITVYQQSSDMFNVGNELRKNMKDTMSDWEIKSTVETKIMEVFEKPKELN
jgi:3'-phosphoadenosine 5'-phosphosulfate sulfotransferase